MLRLSRKTMLAVEAVLDIAFYGGGDPVQAKEITARQGLQQRYLESVMQQLAHERVLRGVRGPRGGYVLAKEPRRITIGEIVRIVSQTEAPDEERLTASELGDKIVAPVWEAAQESFLEILDRTTIADLVEQAEEAGGPRGQIGAGDFRI